MSSCRTSGRSKGDPIYCAIAAYHGSWERPDNGFVDAHDAQTVLLGRLNKLYGVAGAPAAAKTYKGRFGFITD